MGMLRASTVPVVLREPELATGFPDIVAAYPAAYDASIVRPALSVDHLRLLHLLWMNRGATTLAAAQTLLRLSPIAMRRITDELHEQRVIVLRGTTLRADKSAPTFAASRIVAIEAKISKWEDALSQASGNAWFASHSYVLLPSRRIGQRALPHARALGIGVLVVDGSAVVTLARARRRPIPVSLGSWIVNEWMINELGRGKSDRSRGSTNRVS